MACQPAFQARALLRSGAMTRTKRSRLVEIHLPLVRQLASRMIVRARPYLEVDDLVAVGVEALLRAAQRFDPERGVAFATFAYLRVRGAMCESIGLVAPLTRGVVRRRPGRPERRPLLQICRFDDERPVQASSGRELGEQLTGAIDAARLGPRLMSALDTLGQRDRQLILRHYFGGDTLNEIGRDLNRSRSWASRVHSRALARLRDALEPALSAIAQCQAEPAAAS
jgi:RNA polymerase sigma factor for flagellar operon FliA